MFGLMTQQELTLCRCWSHLRNGSHHGKPGGPRLERDIANGSRHREAAQDSTVDHETPCMTNTKATATLTLNDDHDNNIDDHFHDSDTGLVSGKNT